MICLCYQDLEGMGIRRTDPRLQESMSQLFEAQDQNNGIMSEQDFKRHSRTQKF